ncbi:MAG: sensor histidine kinase [Roseiflexaceae bacterium]
MLTGILILFIVLTTACAVSVLRHNRQGAINRAFAWFALMCLLCLALPVMLLDPLLVGGRVPLLLTLYGGCYLFAPAAFVALPLTIYWSSWRRERRALYRFVLLAPTAVAIVLFLALVASAVAEGRTSNFESLSMDEPFRALIARPLDQAIRRGFSAVMELSFVALLLPRALRGRTGVERHTAITLLAASVLTSGFARFPWFTVFGDFPIAGTLISTALASRLFVCYHLLIRYRLFSRAHVGIELAIQNMSDGFILLDEHMRVQAFNPAAAQLLPVLARGAPLPELPADAPVRPLDPQEQPVRMTDAGRTLSLAWSTISDRRGLARGALLLLRDITEHEALAASRAEVEMLQKLNRFKADVIRTMRHELRTPLTAILGYSGALMIHETSEERREFLNIIRRETRRLTRMIEDFLDMSSIQAGSMRYHPRPLDLTERCVLLAERFIETRSTHPLIVDLPAELPPVQADPDRLDQVLTNLVGNAIKYSPAGGCVRISAQVWDRRGPGATANGHSWLRIVVCDQGLGLPPDSLEQIFERFYRVQDDARFSIRGTGLGLAICKEIVQVHGGSIWAESDGPGQGSTFSFTLPAAQEQAVEASA